MKVMPRAISESDGSATPCVDPAVGGAALGAFLGLGDDGRERSLLAFAAVGGSISVLVAASGASYEAIGWGSVTSTGLILLSSLLLWRYRSNDDGAW